MTTVTVSNTAVREIEKGTRLVYASLVKKAKAQPSAGDLVDVVDEKGKWVAKGFYNPNAAVAVQVLSVKKSQSIDDAFFWEKIAKAKAFREKTLDLKNSYRWFYGESDGIPGLVVDRFNHIAVVQISCPGIELRKNIIAEALLSHDGITVVFERNDSRNRLKLGLPVLKGLVKGEGKLQTVIEENGVKFEVDVLRGHKTGFYLDQRENRIALSHYVKKGDSMLDVFSYSGGFGMHCASQGAEATFLDLPEVIGVSQKNAKLNGFANVHFIAGNAFQETQKLISQGEQFDIVSVDPPAFVQKKEDLESGKKGYYQINLNALKLVKEGGILASSSCSQLLGEQDFLDVLVSAAAKAKKTVQFVERRTQSRDHAPLLHSSKGQYLKCFFLRVTEKE